MKKGILTSLGLAAVLTLGLATVNEYRSTVVDAEETTAKIDFSTKGYASSGSLSLQDKTIEIDDIISVKFDKGNNSNEPKYYANGTSVRVYGGSYFTVSAAENYIITSINITFGSSDGSNAISADAGSFTSPNWTGSEKNVKFTIGGSTGNRRIKGLSVTYSDESSAEQEQTPAEKVMQLFGDYYDDGTYVKNTSIYVNKSTSDEIKAMFHGEVSSLHRTTKYTKDQLVMTIKDNATYSSTYGTATIDGVDYMTHEGAGGTYKIANTTMEKYYVTLNDFANGINESSYATKETEDLTKGWSVSDGTYSSSDPAVLDAFRLFTAPLWLNSSEATKNYISFTHATVKVDENDSTLVMKLHASTDGGKFSGSGDVFSVAYIQKGSTHSHHVYEGTYTYVDKDTCSQECLFCKDAEKREHTGGEATTEQKAVCKNCEEEYGELKQEVAKAEASILNREFTGREYKGNKNEDQKYVSWSNKTDGNGIVFAGQSGADFDSIQLRSSNSNSGIVVTNNNTTLKVKKITIVWNSNTANERTLWVYGSNSAYTDPTNLYNDSTDGDKLGEIVCGTSTILEFDSADYSFIGLRSKSGAMYIDSITIEWE